MFYLGIMLALNGISASLGDNLPCEQPICWHVSPRTCVAEKPGQPCNSQLNVNWHSQTALDLCLFLEESQLYCWQAQQNGYWQQQIEWPNAVLSLRQDNKPLLQTELNVMSRNPQRRRIASPWSLF